MNRYLKWMVGGGFFLLPFFVNPFTTDFYQMLDPPKLMAAFLFGNFLFSLYLAKKIHPVLGVAHFTFAASVLLTGFGAVQLYPLAYWLAALTAALWFVEQKREHQVFFLRCLTLSGSVLSCYAFFQAMDLDPIFNYAPGVDRTLPIGTIGQTTKFGAYVAVLAAVAIAIKDWPAAVLCSLAALLTTSSFTYAALAAGIAVNVRYLPDGKKALRFVGALGLVAAPLLYFFAPHTGLLESHGRGAIWRDTFHAWWNGPTLLGYGPGSYGVLFAKNFQSKEDIRYGDFIQAHNDYLQAFFEFGLLGGLVLVALLLVLLKRYYTEWWKKERWNEVVRAALAGLAVLLVNAIGNFPWQLAPHYLVGVIFVSILLKERNDW